MARVIDQIITDLNKLSTTDEVAALFESAGIKGFVREPFHCVISEYILRESGYTGDLSTGITGVFWGEEEMRNRMNFSHVMKMFRHNFDEGFYPQLEIQ